jgi:hypothetical protein
VMALLGAICPPASAQVDRPFTAQVLFLRRGFSSFVRAGRDQKPLTRAGRASVPSKDERLDRALSIDA